MELACAEQLRMEIVGRSLRRDVDICQAASLALLPCHDQCILLALLVLCIASRASESQ